MKTLPLNASDEAVLVAVDEWVDLLVAGDCEAALAYFYYTNENEWAATAEALRTWIENYASTEPFAGDYKARVSPRNEAPGKGHHRCCHRYEAPLVRVEPLDLEIIGLAIYDLPIDGEWSDLTVQIYFCKRQDALVLCLLDLNVM